MAEDLAREIQELLDEMQTTSRPPRQFGSWSAFARIYDVKGTSCWCQLYDNHLLPCERTMDFMMDFSRVDPCFHASCVKQPGLLIGALELNVVDLNPIKALVMEDTIMWNIPMLKPEQPWAISLAHVCRSLLWVVASSQFLQPQLRAVLHRLTGCGGVRQKNHLCVERFL